MEPPKRAAAYIRVSTEDQLEYSPDSQLRLIEEYARRHGFFIPPDFIFLDQGISGRKAERRPAFMAMIAAAKEHPRPFDAILVYALSRFARSREDSVVYKRLLRKDLGVEVLSVTQELGADKTSILVEALLEAMDEYYSVDLGENVRRGMTEKASRGEPVTVAPFGYLLQEGRYLPDPNTAPAVTLLFEQYAAGLGLRELAVQLNRHGLRTRRGNPFDSRGVRYILQNSVYLGKIHWKPDKRTQQPLQDCILADGKHQPIVGEDLWRQVQRRLQAEQVKHRSPQPVSAECGFSLQGLVRCSACGGPLVRSGRGTLQCRAYARGRCHESHSVSLHSLTQRVYQQLELDFPQSTLVLLPRSNDKKSNLIRPLIHRQKCKLERIREAYLSGVDSLEEYERLKRQIQCQLAQLEREDQELSAQEDDSPIELSISKFLSLPIGEGEKNLLLRVLLSSVVFHSAENLLVLNYNHPT